MRTRTQRFIMLWILVGALLALTTGLTLAQEGSRNPLEPQAPVGSGTSTMLSTGFIYQGQLTDGGAPAEGVFDLQFELYDAETDGTLIAAEALENVEVTGGLFAVSLDFGIGAFDGNARWLAISVRPGEDDGAYVPLSPRQPLTAAPYALRAQEAGAVAWAAVYGNPLPGSCAAGEILAWSETQGAWECIENIDTTYSAGFGLALDETTFNVLPDIVQTRVTGTCAPGSMVTTINADGSVVCETDDDTTYGAGFGLALNGSTFDVLTTVVQARVSGSCGVGSTIRAVDADGNVTCGVDAPLNRSQAPLDNEITALDTAGDVGYDTSVTIGIDGLPIISYFDWINQDLKVVHCNDAACSSSALATVDSAGYVGYNTSIAIGTDGLPIISYYDSTNSDLKVAHCSNAACTSATTTAVDTAGSVGQNTSIAIGADGLPIISYFDVTNWDLKAAHCSDTACTSATTTAVDTAGTVGEYTSISIGADGLPIISYADLTSGDLKVAHCSNAACTSALLNAVDTAGTVNGDTSIVIGADALPIISYYEGINSDLKVAHCNDATCSSATLTTLDTSGDVGHTSSITIGADGLPIISYYDYTNGDLKVAHCSDASCTVATTVVVDTAGDVGQFTSITIGTDGLSVISYYDYANGDLKVTHCSNTFCVPYFRRR